MTALRLTYFILFTLSIPGGGAFFSVFKSIRLLSNGIKSL